jgi:hypothetical protein
MRTVIGKTIRPFVQHACFAFAVLKKRSPGHRRPGPISTPISAVLLRGQTAVVSDALCRFQNANDALPADAQNVTESRKSCEVPSLPQGALGAVDNTSSGGNGPRLLTLIFWWCAHRPGARCQPLGAL